MTAHRFLTSRNLRRAWAGSWAGSWAGAAVLLVAGLTPAAAQFPSPPGQSQNSRANSPFPPAPGQTAAASPANNPFPPAPGQQQQQQQPQQSPGPFPGP